MGSFTALCAPFDRWGAPKCVKYSSMVKVDATITFLMLNIISDQISRYPWGALKWIKYSSMVKMDAVIIFLMLNIISDQISRDPWAAPEWVKYSSIAFGLLAPGVSQNG